MIQSLLIARVRGERVAFPVAAITTTALLETVHPVPGAPAFVAGIMSNRSQTLTVIDTARALGLADAEALPEYAIVMMRQGCGYALAVDEIEQVAETCGPVEPVRGTALPGWRRVALGQVETSAGAVLLADWERLLDPVATPVAA